MIIKEIHIDNYGKYSAHSYDNLSAGVNVIYGPNEHGKTTLLEFIRRMFFGFPKKAANKNRYEPLNGAKPGGRMICSLDSGEEFTLERNGWTKRGALEVTFENGRKITSQQELNELLRAGEMFYHNVYAITIEELYSRDSLNGEDIKNRIYGAGLDLGGVSLAQVKKYFQSKANDIFQVRGTKQEIYKLNEKRKALEIEINSASDRLSRYEEILKEQSENKKSIISLHNKISSLNDLQVELKNKCSALNDFIDYQDTKSNLDALPPSTAIRQDDIDDYIELKAELKNLLAENNRLNNKLRLVNEDLTRKVFSNNLLKCASDITMLERSAERFRSERENIKKLNIELDNKKNEAIALNKDIAFIWQAEKVPDVFSFEMNFMSRVKDFQARFDDLRQQLITAKALEQQAPKKSDHRNIITLSLLLLLAIVTICAVIILKPLFATIIVLLFSLPITLTLAKVLKKNTNETSQSSAAIEKESLNNDWKKLLTENGFKESLLPADILECAAKHNALVKAQNENSKLTQEINETQSWLGNIETALDKVAKSCNELVFTSDPIANIEIIADKYKADERTKAEYDKLVSEQKNLEYEIKISAEKLNDLEAASQIVLDKFEVKDLGSLREALNCEHQRTSLQDKLAEKVKALKNIFGIEAEIEDIHNILAEFSREDSEKKIAEIGEQRQELTDELADLNQLQGKLSEEAANLVSADKLAELQNNYEVIVELLKAKAACWTRFRVGQLLIDRAVSKYEQERQPEVINHASSIFEDLTGGAYVKIRKPAESDDLLLIDRKGASRSVLELSRGTREQLYLSMRLGLIAQYEEQTESLPIVFDDILVNFDKKRLKSAVNAIFKFANKRQVILLTCHENIHSLLIKHGATDLSTTND